MKEQVAFIERLLKLQTASKLAHLSTKSFSQHLALGELYDGLSDLIDTFIESYQGQYGIVKLTWPEAKAELIKEKIQGTAEEIMKSGKTLFKETYLQNQLDEITSLLYHIKYKLDNLA